ncbi:hypothetical protein [Ascidiimonas sp. W6]|uniref:hypothetical protein n=1 Tax=Ascidiimonas meishanensis TaxID=3128903 RepID=UPI0030EC0628
MDKSCAPAPSDKKEYITAIGKILVEKHGKKRYYKPEEVKKAHRESKWYATFDFSCWAMSTFSSHTDFDLYHQAIGETCNYTEMKTEMLQGLSASSTTDWTDITAIDIDDSWLDFGSVFEGIGELISGIFDAL